MMKQAIIVDKNVFQTQSAFQALTNLTSDHLVILPHVLLEECLTTEKYPGPITLLEKAENLVKAGASVSLSLGRMFAIEKDTLQPLPSIIDETATTQVRSNTIRDFHLDLKKEAKECRNYFEPIRQRVEELANAFWNTLSSKSYSTDWRQPGEDNVRTRRLRKFHRLFDSQMDQWLQKLLPTIHSHITKDWISRHILQAILVYGVEWAFKRNQSGPSYDDFDITNDVYDLEYLSCLCRSDVLISNDTPLVELVQAILPTKSIYNKVPDVLWQKDGK